MREIDPKVDEAIETLGMRDGVARRRLLSGAGLSSASAAASALLAACTSPGAGASGPGRVAGDFPATPRWRFTFVNHVTTNPFFVPTRYGAGDACALVGCSYSWTGSQTSNVPEMVSALNAAVSSGANGIAVSVINATAFTTPVADAVKAGVPVVSYNADGVPGNRGTSRLAYIGQDLYLSGQELGRRIVAAMPAGGQAVGFIATPGAANLQPRIDGARAAIQASGKAIKFTAEVSGASLPQESTTINAYVLGHKSSLRGVFAVDGGSTQTVGAVIRRQGLQGRVVSGGFDTTPQTIGAIRDGSLDFTIDQQPYLQGFLPVLYLYLFNLSGGLIRPPETNTGLTVVTRSNLAPYLTTSRYEGSTSRQRYIQRSGPIT